MMKRCILFHIALLACVLVLAPACKKEFDLDKVKGQPMADTYSPFMTGDGALILPFGEVDDSQISISTRVAQEKSIEGRVANIYAMIFDADGNKVYGYYFDNEKRQGISNSNYVASSLAAEPMDKGNIWFVHNLNNNAVAGANSTSHGALRMLVPDEVKDGHIYLVSGLDPAMVNVTEQRLDIVQTEDELKEMVISMQQLTVFRSAYFLMVGSSKINITKGADASLNVSVEDGDYAAYTAEDGHSGNAIFLKRNDAKVTVKIAVVPGAETELKYDSEGNLIPDGSDTPVASFKKQKIVAFTPTSWRVFNVPKKCHLISHSEEENAHAPFSDFFDTANFPFESRDKQAYSADNNTTIMRDVDSFEFYMFENRQKAKPGKTIDSYHQRDLQNKYTADNPADDIEAGDYNPNGSEGRWAYAPEGGTFIEIKGEVTMQPDLSEELLLMQTINASVTYYVHLGDFGATGSLDDFSINRNTHYTYNIYVSGVQKIEIEVERDCNLGWSSVNEEQSGAMGQVYRAKEGLMSCDCHFDQSVKRFSAEALESEKMLTWYVQSPFGRQGVPDRVGGDEVEIATGMDYKWVHFHINTPFDRVPNNNGADSGTPYGSLKHNRWWRGVDYEAAYLRNPANTYKIPYTMDVMEFCRFLREQSRLYFSNDPVLKARSIFSDTDYVVPEEVIAEGEIQPRGIIHPLYVTIYVDEFYYDVDPITEQPDPLLWKKFVNVPDRRMHILCNALISKDGDSAISNSAVSISQHSIQTIYEVQNSNTGWGVETVDETADVPFFFKATEKFGTNPGNTSISNAGDSQNGLSNTASLWNLRNGTSLGTQYWNTYLDYNKDSFKSTVSELRLYSDNNIHFLKDDNDHAVKRYACMSRNRDENGNGKIEASEVKWYLASRNQASLLYIGDQGLSSEAQFYQGDRSAPNTPSVPYANTNVYGWRHHVYVSTCDERGPIEIWAEEGLSTSKYRQWETWGGGKSFYCKNNIRCARNLGVSFNNETEATEALFGKTVIESAISAYQADDGTYVYDLTKLNLLSTRVSTNAELSTGNEASYMSRPSSMFQTGAYYTYTTLQNGTAVGINIGDYPTLKSYMDRGVQICPEGYHVPNIREFAIMYLYVPEGASRTITETGDGCMNYYSFGPSSVGGNNNDAGNGKYSWSINGGNIQLDPLGHMFNIRCVRDVLPNN